MPAVLAEHVRELAGADAGDDAVERLAVEVDDPGDVAEVAARGVGDRLPHVALVEFGIADQRDEPAILAGAEMRSHVAVDHAREQRCRGAQADGAGREVDRVGILRAARVRLQPAKVAQPAELGAVEPAQQVIDGVQHGRGVRLHGDPVATAQPVEVERRHDGDERRRRGLVAADLETVVGGSLAVREIDHARRQPQHAALDLVEFGEGWGVGAGHAHDGQHTQAAPSRSPDPGARRSLPLPAAG